MKKGLNQKGFSLVELMVVVAIIGILAAIAIPNVSKYMAKARQSEAKTNLASIYTAEKAFFSEYSTYDSRFAAVGFSPEGQLRYNVGFGANGVQAGAAAGYNVTPPITAINSLAYCGASGTMSNGCTTLNGATGQQPAALAAAYTTTATGFTAGATSVIATTNGTDVWTITEAKVIRNVTPGIR